MNAVQRFIRSRVLLLTASILIVAMCLSVLVQGQSQAALSRTVDRELPGALRRPGPGQGGTTAACMQPDIATGQGGISFDQLDAIRKLSGTSVAAPISLVSRVTQNLESPRLDATDYLGFNAGLAGTAGDPTATDPGKWPAAESVLSDTPKKYRLTASAVSSDGHSEQTLFKTTAEGSLGKAKLVEEQVAGGKSVRIARPGGRDRHQVPRPRRRLRAQPLQPLRVPAHGAAGDRVRGRRRPRLRTRPARHGRRLPGSAGEGPARRRPQRRRDRPPLRKPLHQRHQHGRAQGRPRLPRRQAQVLGAADDPVPAGQARPASSPPIRRPSR